MNILTLAEIKAQMPEKYTEKQKSYRAGHYSNSWTKDVRRMFGRSLLPLTVARLHKLKGCVIYYVDGGDWEDLPEASQVKRMNRVRQMQILDPDNLTSKENIAFKSQLNGGKRKGNQFVNRDGILWWPVRGKDYHFSICSYDSDQYSNGRHPIWIFASEL